MITQTESPTLCFDTDVVRVQRLSPCFTRITFGGECLSRFDGGGALGPRDLRIKVIAPVSGVAPDPVDTSGPGWYQAWLQRDPRSRGEMRTYTVRAARTAGPHPEVDVDFVLHGADGHCGPAATWAASASVGDRMLLLGPNAGCTERYGGIEWQPPATGGRVLLVGDETAVPAVASILETLPGSYSGHALLEVPTAGDFLPLHSAADVRVTWLARSARPRGEALAAAVRDVVPPRPDGAAVEVPEVDPDLLWETPTGEGQPLDAPYAWIAGEAGVVKQLRRYLVGAAGVPRSSVAFMGYWREGASL
jgi:NADPH-dependent ferric siderophore reductase